MKESSLLINSVNRVLKEALASGHIESQLFKEQTQHISVHYEMSGFEGLLFEGGRSEIITVDFTTHTCHCQHLTMQVRPHRFTAVHKAS